MGLAITMNVRWAGLNPPKAVATNSWTLKHVFSDRCFDETANYMRRPTIGRYNEKIATDALLLTYSDRSLDVKIMF